MSIRYRVQFTDSHGRAVPSPSTYDRDAGLAQVRYYRRLGYHVNGGAA